MGRRLLWILLVLLLGFIWGHSLQNGRVSQAESQSVLHLALNRWGTLPGMGYLNFYTIRKLAHLTEFAALGMVLEGLAGRSFLALLLGAPWARWMNSSSCSARTAVPRCPISCWIPWACWQESCCVGCSGGCGKRENKQGKGDRL